MVAIALCSHSIDSLLTSSDKLVPSKILSDFKHVVVGWWEAVRCRDPDNEIANVSQGPIVRRYKQVECRIRATNDNADMLVDCSNEFGTVTCFFIEVQKLEQINLDWKLLRLHWTLPRCAHRLLMESGCSTTNQQASQ